MHLRRIGVASAARVAGVLYAVIGIVAGLLVAAISLGSAGFMAGAAPDEGLPPFLGPIFGVGAVVIFPILYGLIGIIFGTFVAVVYNLVAGLVGGLELEFDDSRALNPPGR